MGNAQLHSSAIGLAADHPNLNRHVLEAHKVSSTIFLDATARTSSLQSERNNK